MQIKLTDLAKELMSSGLKDPANPEQYASFIPFQGTPASAGYDIRACIDEPKKIAFGETLLIPCGFHLHIKDPNIVGKLYVRSSVGTKLGLVLANGTGIIDSDYQDEWMLAIHCYRRPEPYGLLTSFIYKVLDKFTEIPISLQKSRRLLSCFVSASKALAEESEDFITIYPAQRLAQVVFTPVVHPMFYHIESFTESSDRLGGFGSTDSIRLANSNGKLGNPFKKQTTDGKEYGG